jgi:hypothetical protein
MPTFMIMARNSTLRICKSLKLQENHHVNGYNEKTSELESIRSEIQEVEEEKRKINEEERKLLWMDYERAVQNYDKAPQSTPLPTPTIQKEEFNTSQFSAEFLEHRRKVLSQQTEKPTPKITPVQAREKDSTSEAKVEKATREQSQQGFVVRIVNFVRDFFTNIFKL